MKNINHITSWESLQCVIQTYPNLRSRVGMDSWLRDLLFLLQKMVNKITMHKNTNILKSIYQTLWFIHYGLLLNSYFFRLSCWKCSFTRIRHFINGALTETIFIPNITGNRFVWSDKVWWQKLDFLFLLFSYLFIFWRHRSHSTTYLS